MTGSTPATSTQTQQTQSKNEPPEFIQPYLKQGIGDLSTLYAQRPNAPAYYPGSTVAPMSGMTADALSRLFQRGQNGSPVTGAASDQLIKTIRGDYLDPNSNPYWTGALDASLKPQTEQFMNQIIPGITSAFQGSNRTGSGAQQGQVDQAVTNLTRSQADARTKAASDAFTTNRSQQLQAVGMAPAIANQDYTDIMAMGQAGSGMDDQAQRLTDADVARYNYGNNSQWDYIARYLGLMNGAYPGGSSSGTQTGTGSSTPATNPFSQIMGAGTSTAGLGLSAALMFSDERLKEDISPVGKLADGQTIYSYRYKGDSTPRIGLLAQDVERRRPDAVATHPSGFKMVDYGKATEAARGLF